MLLAWSKAIRAMASGLAAMTLSTWRGTGVAVVETARHDLAAGRLERRLDVLRRGRCRRRRSGRSCRWSGRRPWTMKLPRTLPCSDVRRRGAPVEALVVPGGEVRRRVGRGELDDAGTGDLVDHGLRDARGGRTDDGTDASGRAGLLTDWVAMSVLVSPESRWMILTGLPSTPPASLISLIAEVDTGEFRAGRGRPANRSAAGACRSSGRRRRERRHRWLRSCSGYLHRHRMH